MNSLAKRFTWQDWGIEGNYVWCLVIVVIFMGLGGANRWGDVLTSSFGKVRHKRVGQFLLGGGGGGS